MRRAFHRRLFQWRTCGLIDATAQIFVNLQFFQVKTKNKRSQPTATHIKANQLAFLQLLEPLCTPSPPLPLDEDYLNLLKKLASASFS